METRIRLLIEAAGLPRPRVQWVVQDVAARTAVWLDLAWPEIMVGIEYEGEVHGTPRARRQDTRRYTALVDKGWRIYRYTSDEVLGKPDRIIAELTRACAQVR